MDETIKQSELRNNNAEIMRRVAAEESFTVTVHGQPIADLVPHQRGGHPQEAPGSCRRVLRPTRQRRAPRRTRPPAAQAGSDDRRYRRPYGFSLATRNGADLRHLERALAVIDVD